MVGAYHFCFPYDRSSRTMKASGKLRSADNLFRHFHSDEAFTDDKTTNSKL